MTPLTWSLLLSAIGVVGIFLAGRRSWTGWALGLAAQLLWVAYALTTGTYGFLLSAAGYGSVYALNLARWRRDARQSTPTEGEPSCAPSTTS